MPEERIGTIAHVWRRAGSAQVELERSALRIGDVIRIRGRGREFVQRVESMEVEHEAKAVGRPGEHVAIGVFGPVHERDEVFRIR